MIQVLTYDGSFDVQDDKDIKVNNFHDFESFDSYDVNVISLLNKNIWYNTASSRTKVNCIEDFRSLNTAIRNSKSKVVIIFPENYLYSYRLLDKKYIQRCELKNMMVELRENILTVLSDDFRLLQIEFEKNKFIIDDCSIEAPFYFNKILDKNICLYAKDSRKALGIAIGNIVYTTLKIINFVELKKVLQAIGFIENKESVPDWIGELVMFNDNDQIDIIREKKQIISAAQSDIEEAKKVLDQNNRLKSILYETGETLADIVKEILSDMLGEDFTEFVDEKKEDFRTNVEGKVILGEIKGINSNVRLENVSQLDIHYQTFLDDNPEINDEDVVALLIINYQRKKPLVEREPVHERQIMLAERNGSLIIDSYTFLKLYEKYKKGELTRKQCFEILTQNTGLLQIV